MKECYLKDNNDKNKKAKGTKTCVIIRKLIFQYYKKLFRSISNWKWNKPFRKNTIDVDSHNKFIKNNKLIWRKIKKVLEVKSVNVFTEEINKIALSSNDDKRMQSIDSIEAFADGTSNDLLWKKKKEELKCNNIMKQHKNVLLWLYYKKRYKRT